MSNWKNFPELNMGWVRTEYRWPRRRAVLTVDSSRLSKMLERVETPEELEREVRKVILAFKPQLSGCVIEFMDFDLHHGHWRIGVSHESLPVLTDFSKIDDHIPLVNEET